MHDLLKIMRANLLEDFTNEELEIYIPCFKYKQEKTLMSLSIEKYFIGWLNSFWFTLKEYSNNTDNIDIIEDSELIDLYLQLINKWEIQGVSSKSSKLVSDLLQEKIKTIKNILEVAEKSQKNYNHLYLQYEKDKVFFEKSIKNLEEKDCGIC